MKSLCLGYGVIVSYEFKLANTEDVFAEFICFFNHAILESTKRFSFGVCGSLAILGEYF